jgi:two-component system, NarL family, sensor kinase
MSTCSRPSREDLTGTVGIVLPHNGCVDVATPSLGHGQPSRRTRASVLSLLVVIAVGVVLGAMLLARAWNISVPDLSDEPDTLLPARALLVEKLVAAILFALTGWLLTLRGKRLMAGLALSAALADTLAVVGSQWTLLAMQHRPAESGASLALWVTEVTLAVEPAVLVGFLALFPRGRRNRGLAGGLATAAFVVACVAVIGAAVSPFDPDPDGPIASLHNPLSIRAIADILGAGIPIAFLLSTGVFLARWWRATGADRLLFRALGVIVVFGFVRVVLPVDLATGQVLYGVYTVLFLLGVLAAAVGQEVYGVRLALDRAYAYAFASLVVTAVYIATVALGAELGASDDRSVGLLATLAAALVLVPARERAQRAVNRFLYGQRDDPFAVLSSIAATVETSASRTQLLQRLVDVVTDTLRVPSATLELESSNGPIRRFTSGTTPELVDSFELVERGILVGRLVIGRRAGQESLGRSERTLLAQIARQAAAAAHATILEEQVSLSRARAVAVAEDERRRLRRELHEGLGPSLTGVATRLDACCNIIGSDADRVAALLPSIRADVGRALDDLRQVVYGLRPPALDELGLLGALEEHVARTGMPVHVDVPPALPELPAAVEITAFRVVAEALSNVVRHAHATHCRLNISVGEHLTIQVDDDGRAEGPWRLGVGLAEMRDRVAEMGGTFDAGATTTGGRVQVRLPLSLVGVGA